MIWGIRYVEIIVISQPKVVLNLFGKVTFLLCMSKCSCCGHNCTWFIFNPCRICPGLRCSICKGRMYQQLSVLCTTEPYRVFTWFMPLVTTGRGEHWHTQQCAPWPEGREAHWYHVGQELQRCVIVPYKLQLLAPRVCCALSLMWKDVLQEEKEEIAKTFSGTSLFPSETELFCFCKHIGSHQDKILSTFLEEKIIRNALWHQWVFCEQKQRRNPFFFSAIQHVTR